MRYYTSDPDEYLKQVRQQLPRSPDFDGIIIRILKGLIRLCHWGAVRYPAAFFALCVTPFLAGLGWIWWSSSVPLALLAIFGAVASLTYGFYLKASPRTRFLIAGAYLAAIAYQFVWGFETESVLLFVVISFSACAASEAWLTAQIRANE